MNKREFTILLKAQHDSVFRRLWTVCQLTEPFFRKDFELTSTEYPFTDAFSLFTQITQEFINAKGDDDLPLTARLLAVARQAANEEVVIKDALEDFYCACSRLFVLIGNEKPPLSEQG